MSFATGEVARVSTRLQSVAKKIVLEVGKRLVERSPVDTGRFRAGWQYGKGRVPAGVDVRTPSTLPRGEAPGDHLAGLQTAALLGDVGVIHYYANNVEYAASLEAGSSGQAPAGIVGPVKLEFDGIIRAIDRATP